MFVKDLTKVLFVCFFYSALFPASFLFGFAILLVQYHADKFCLLRVWGYSPTLGSTLAVYSRRYFFTGAGVAFMIASAYAFFQFRKFLRNQDGKEQFLPLILPNALLSKPMIMFVTQLELT